MKKISRKTTIVTKQLTTIAMFTALVTVATVVIAIPAPAGGFLNVGDTVVLIAADCLGPIGGMTAGGLGSCIADLILGYGMYAPFTLIIKGLEGLICGCLIMLFDKTLGKRYRNYIAQVIAGVLAMIIAALTMSSLYCIADGILYGWGAAIVNAPINLLQGAIGVTAGSVIVYALNLPKLAKRFGVKIVIREWVSKSEATELSECVAESDKADNDDIVEANTEESAENSVLGEAKNLEDSESCGNITEGDRGNTVNSVGIDSNSLSDNISEIIANAQTTENGQSDIAENAQKESNAGGYKTDVGRYQK